MKAVDFIKLLSKPHVSKNDRWSEITTVYIEGHVYTIYNPTMVLSYRDKKAIKKDLVLTDDQYNLIRSKL